MSFLDTNRRFLIAWILLLSVMGGCSVSTVPPAPTATATLPPTLTPTHTSTPSPTQTEIPPTPTKQLSPQEQLERDFGHLVPGDERCIGLTNFISNMRDYLQPGVEMAELIVRSTGTTDKITIPFGVEKTPREVTTLQVVCRDGQGRIAKPMWLILGGDDFGKHQNGENPFWYNIPDATGFESSTPEEVLANMETGTKISVRIPVKKGSVNLKDTFTEWEIQGNPFEMGNELANETMRQFDNPANKEQWDLLVQGQSASVDNFLLFPLMIEYDRPQ